MNELKGMYEYLAQIEDQWVTLGWLNAGRKRFLNQLYADIDCAGLLETAVQVAQYDLPSDEIMSNPSSRQVVKELSYRSFNWRQGTSIAELQRTYAFPLPHRIELGLRSFLISKHQPLQRPNRLEEKHSRVHCS